MSIFELNVFRKGTAIKVINPVLITCETLVEAETKCFNQQRIVDKIADGKYEVALIHVN